MTDIDRQLGRRVDESPQRRVAWPCPRLVNEVTQGATLAYIAPRQSEATSTKIDAVCRMPSSTPASTSRPDQRYPYCNPSVTEEHRGIRWNCRHRRHPKSPRAFLVDGAGVSSPHTVKFRLGEHFPSQMPVASRDQYWFQSWRFCLHQEPEPAPACAVATHAVFIKSSDGAGPRRTWATQQ